MLNTKYSNFLGWSLLFGLFILQYGEFYCYLQREITPFYPTNYDQAAYLPYVYTLYEKIKQFGFSMLWNYPPMATGLLFPLNALISFFVLGASRFTALLPNFCYFIVLQLIAFLTAKQLSGKITFGLLLVGLILTLNTPFYIGGIADFRMDFIAFSLYGIFTCMTLQSRVFLLRKMTLCVGLIVLLMILMRFITLIYFTMIASLLLMIFALQWYASRSIETREHAQTRFLNLISISFFIMLALVPILLLTHHALYEYYIVGHIKGIEAQFRSLPKTESWINLYPDLIKSFHFAKMGRLAVKIVFYSYALLYLISFLFRQSMKKPIFNLWVSGGFLILTILCPIIILSLDPAKSSVVGGIVDIPILMLLVLFCIYVDSRYILFKNNINYLMVSCVLVLGLIHQWDSYMKKTPQTELTELNTLNQMYQDIASYSMKAHWPAIRLTIDYVTDYLNIGSFATLHYEKYGKLINIVPERLGSALFYPITEQESLDSLKASNVVILTVGDYPDKSFFPGNQSIIPFRTNLLQYADSHFHILGDYTFLGYHRRVYVS